MYSFPSVDAVFGVALPQKATTPDHLPDSESLLKFDIDRKKSEIFEAVRERVRSKAQYTNTGRKPWTQITATIPIKPATTENEDLAVIWKMMDKCTHECDFKEDEKGYIWTMWGDDDYLKWLGIDPEKTKPVNKFVHPVMFETGERKKTKLTNQLRKAEKNACIPSQIRLQKELDTYEAELAQKQLNPPQGNDYHWAGYEQCIVTFKKKQTRKVAKELQLTVKVRTFHLGWGDPAENNGYMRGSKGSIDNLDPESKGYELLKDIRPY